MLPRPRAARQAYAQTSMSFVTALGLSARNLMTKKGRTAMTAFAGSIGIIGIAAILALSNGVNGYIKKVEEDTLSSYPLTISKQDYDLSSMMGGQGAADDDSPENVDSSDDSAGDKAQGNDKIPVVTAVKDMFASVKSNDMTSFKAWLDAGGDGIDKEVNAIQYGYGVSPVVYRAGKGDEKPVRLVPNAMTEAMSGGASSAATVSMESMGTSVFNEMIDDQSLLDSQYDVVAGHWPTSANEAVMVLSSRGTVGDYTLYSIGALDINELNDLVNSAMTADGGVETPETGTEFTYDDALSTTFKVLSPADAYRKNEETGIWTDMSGDTDFMAAKVADGIDVHIVGVVRPNETANASALSPGIAYTHALTRQLMERAADSQIVQEQLAHPRRMSLRAKPSTNCKARPSKAWIWAACSVWTRQRSRARFRSIHLRSRVQPAVWTFLASICRGWTLTFRALARTSTSATSWQKRQPQISRVSLTVWNSRPSKCSRWEH